jgi:hypothetical protein
LLKPQARGKKTTLQANELQEKRNTLHRHIENWRQIQAVYMPAVAGLLTATPAAAASNPESTPLYLPSDLPQEPLVARSLADKERRLRLAQANDSLAKLKRLIRITMGLWEYKYTQVGPSQRASTCTRTMIFQFKDKINRCADRYRAAHTALLKLDPCGDWITQLQELKPGDIQGPGKGKDEEHNKKGYNSDSKKLRSFEGRRELSWIWVEHHEGEGQDSESEITVDEINDGQLSFTAFPLLTRIFHRVTCRMGKIRCTGRSLVGRCQSGG